MNQLLFLDVEATGVDKEDRICQVAYKYGEEVVDELFKPPVPIKLPAMAITHITEKMVADKQTFEASMYRGGLQQLNKDGFILVAHNAKYDLGMLEKEGVYFDRHICTMKIARHLDEGDKYENHQMQYLRYYYGIEIEATAHDALGDILVLEQVFNYLRDELKEVEGLLDDEETTKRMIEISSKPSLIRVIRFGKYKDRKVADIAKNDPSYLAWLLNEKRKSPEGEEDWIYTLETHLN